LINEDRDIPGLNLGLNTSEDPEVIRENRRWLLDYLNISGEWFADARQIHGNHVKVVVKGGTYSKTDGLITRVPGLALGIQVADCAAMLLAGALTHVVGAFHAGWRGARGGVLQKAVRKMTELGSRPEDIHAFISPSICQEHFEVGKEVAGQFPDRHVDYQSFSKPRLNLKGFLVKQLKEQGIPETNIEMHKGCSVGESRKYYSYRREEDRSGRMIGIIRIKQS